MGDSTAWVGLCPFRQVSGPCLLRHATLIDEDLEDPGPVLDVSIPKGSGDTIRECDTDKYV